MRIGIVRLSALGDITHSMIVLEFIKKHYPDSSIDWFVDKKFSKLLIGNNNINKLFELDIKNQVSSKKYLKFWRTLWGLKKLPKYDLVIDLQGLIKSAIVTRFINSKKTYGFSKKSIKESFASNFYSSTFSIPYSENVIRRNLALVSFALQKKFSELDILNKKSFLFYTNNKDIEKIDERFILIVPFASFESKVYPKEKYEEVTRLVDYRFLVLYGDDKEKVIAQEIKDGKQNVELIGSLNLNQLKNLVDKSDLVIGGDTGPVHIAWGLNKPSICLFGPTDPFRNFIKTKKNKFLCTGIPDDPYKINKFSSSIRNIKVMEIVKMINSLISL